MADNVTTNGITIATNDVGGVHHQKWKIVDGATGGTEAVKGTAANGLWVDVTRVAKTPLTGSAPAFASIGLASSSALAVNVNRKGLAMVNTSANWISLAFGAPAILYSGICLAPNGGSFAMGTFDFSTQEVRAIASGAGSNLAIQEFV